MARTWQARNTVGPDHGLPVVAEVDVCVVGGGAAGVAAAETAARHGCSTLLVERYGFCGGNAVAGLSGTVCGLYLSSARAKNRPEQVVFGFADFFKRAMEAAGGLTPPQRYGRTWNRPTIPWCGARWPTACSSTRACACCSTAWLWAR